MRGSRHAVAVGRQTGSTAPVPAGPAETLPSSVSEPLGLIAKLEMKPDPVFTANRNCPFWLIVSQRGAV